MKEKRDDGYRKLMCAIIEQAVDDYVYCAKSPSCELNRMNIQNQTLQDDVVSFFNSEWCDGLLQGIALNGRDILDYLSKKLA